MLLGRRVRGIGWWIIVWIAACAVCGLLGFVLGTAARGGSPLTLTASPAASRETLTKVAAAQGDTICTLCPLSALREADGLPSAEIAVEYRVPSGRWQKSFLPVCVGHTWPLSPGLERIALNNWIQQQAKDWSARPELDPVRRKKIVEGYQNARLFER